MTLAQASILGIVQGLTEFLPVSSSGHLLIFHTFFGTATNDLTFDVILHLGTLIALIIFFNKDLISLYTQKTKELILATIPAVIFGFYLYRYPSGIFSDFHFNSISLLLTSLLVFIGVIIPTKGKDLKKLNLFDSLVVGIFQAIAIIPGISRSGATFAGGRLVNLSKESTFKFSFMMSIPAIFGALILTAKDITSVNQIFTLPLLFGFIASILSGLFALRFLKYLFSKGSLYPFVIYTFLLGSFLLGLTY